MNDLELLPTELAAKSFSNCEIVLQYDDAMEAIEHLAASGYYVFAWEGWIKYPDGNPTHSGQHQELRAFWGTKGQPIEHRIKEVFLRAQKTIRESQQQWNDTPEVIGGTLYFCLFVEAA